MKLGEAINQLERLLGQYGNIDIKYMDGYRDQQIDLTDIRIDQDEDGNKIILID